MTLNGYQNNKSDTQVVRFPNDKRIWRWFVIKLAFYLLQYTEALNAVTCTTVIKKKKVNAGIDKTFSTEQMRLGRTELIDSKSILFVISC